MRSTALLTSALAVGALAKPLRHQHKRYFITTEELDIVTVTKYVTEGYGEPAPTAAAAPSSAAHHHHSHSAPSAQQPSSVYAPPPVVVSTPAAAPSSAAAPPPVVSSQAAAPSSKAAASSQAAAPSSAPSTGGDYSKYSGTTATSGQDYKDSITYFHNVARSNHGHDAVQWDDSLASTAQTVANTCKFKHWAPVTGQGQNLFAASGAMGHIAEDLMSGWYTGEYHAMEGNWNLAQLPDSLFGEVGHLTQMVWKDTQKIGCASIDCSSQGGVLSESTEGANDWAQRGLKIMHVCQYSPPGNYANEYAQQVGQGLVDGITNNTNIASLVPQIAAASKKSY